MSSVNDAKTVYVVVQCIDYADVKCVKTSHAAAVEFVINDILHGCVTPPYGSQKKIVKTHKKYVDWLKGLSQQDMAILKADPKVGPQHDTVKQWFSLCDTYEYTIDKSVLTN